jgi:hypothetical protein
MPRSCRTALLQTCLICSLLLVACGKQTVNVNLHGVNYSGETFTYSVADPATPENAAGGELIDPFGAGGTICCATLPSKWRPGIKLQVRTTHWLKKLPDGSLPEVKQVNLLEVPRYVDDKPGELWVLRGGDGNVSILSTDFQPDHAQWPGKVKGWPIRRWSISVRDGNCIESMKREAFVFLRAYWMISRDLLKLALKRLGNTLGNTSLEQ